MAKIQIKSEKITPFGGFFPNMDAFNRVLGGIVDSTLGLRNKLIGYQYSEIICSLMCVYFCDGICIEDLSKHLLPCVSQHPKLRTCSSNTILRAIKELTEDNISYTSDIGKTYEFNKAEKLNTLLMEALLTTWQFSKGGEYDFDFEHQFIETEKYDAKTTYKHFRGYGPGIATINNLLVGVENRDGNTNVRFHQQDTLERMFLRLEGKGLKINRARKDCGSWSEEIVEMIENHCKHFYIRADRCSSLYDDIFALRGWKREEINDQEFELNSILVEK